ncbi:hypothetical protein N483_03720 [Pseudoalteromonas luteoviolacea NCIMB 1944]|uniref:Uncharacterized protein n=1 Tax=Pseudoalteromonas luteoviolacea (strain 2ta16) TaxID=1353533 RepID=V4HAR7_PSEL2|nr:hypothetical protein PL2TA16_00571 [Pseudoalteromonas luteoviolacea 2ta16]KZN32267.1 hypothetical protein N483_03720 [Pseudoalteromonas luteoviolacea NCIMB 1944]
MIRLDQVELATIAYWGYRTAVYAAFFYFILQAYRRGIAVFYDKRLKLTDTSDKDLVSWGITISVMFVLQWIDHLLHFSLIGLEMDYLLRRRLFYVIKLSLALFFIFIIIALHTLRGCTFSRLSRLSMYLVIPSATVNFMQLIFRGYLESEALRPWIVIVIVSVQICYFVAIFSYLAMQLFADYKRYIRGRKNDQEEC